MKTFVVEVFYFQVLPHPLLQELFHITPRQGEFYQQSLLHCHHDNGEVTATFQCDRVRLGD